MDIPPIKNQSFEIAKHDPLYVEQNYAVGESYNDEEEDEDIEVESLLFASKQRRLSLDEMDFDEHESEHNVVGMNCCCTAKHRAGVLALLATVLGVVSFLMTQDMPLYFSAASINRRLPDMCQTLLNTSIDELMEQVSNMTTQMERCYESNSCSCENTLVAQPQVWEGSKFQLWNKTHQRNKGLVQDSNQNYDVVFYGDSITEHWMGTDLAQKWTEWLNVKEVFDKYFNTSANEKAHYDGIPLGIGGDRVRGLS
jgi:hypothetical protein